MGTSGSFGAGFFTLTLMAVLAGLVALVGTVLLTDRAAGWLASAGS